MDALGPFSVRDFENVWIPMPDGLRLAARLWLPEIPAQDRVPAILEYLPYHKRNRMRSDDETHHPYWAAHGYACIRVDIRGSGDSEGRSQDEYVAQEQIDGREILQWLAAQPWCTGAVGMVGYSWGGINSLQMAAEAPPELKAIITHCSTDDRYATDCHYKGGCIVHDMLTWGAYWLSYQAEPSDPVVRGGTQWKTLWKERLDGLEFYMAHWFRHPHRDDFWQHGSVSSDYGRIRCPVYAIGGWADPYRDAVVRLMKGLTGPRKALIGPWTHGYPHVAGPGPNIDYLAESLRWWDYWLKGIPTGIMDEPMIRVWMQSEAPIAGERAVPGRWVSETAWPAPSGL